MFTSKLLLLDPLSVCKWSLHPRGPSMAQPHVVSWALKPPVFWWQLGTEANLQESRTALTSVFRFKQKRARWVWVKFGCLPRNLWDHFLGFVWSFSLQLCAECTLFFNECNGFWGACMRVQCAVSSLIIWVHLPGGNHRTMWCGTPVIHGCIIFNLSYELRSMIGGIPNEFI